MIKPGRVRHLNGTATSTPARVDFGNPSSRIIIQNMSSDNLLVSFDNGRSFFTIIENGRLDVDARAFFMVVASDGSSDYEALVIGE